MDRADVKAWRERFKRSESGLRLDAAIEREDWKVAALYILLEATEMLEELGPEAMEALLDELEPAPHRGSRGRNRRAGHGRPG